MRRLGNRCLTATSTCCSAPGTPTSATATTPSGGRAPVLDLPDTALPAPDDGSKLWGDGFEIETLINIRVARHYRAGVREVPSVEKERIYGESNLNAVRDGMRVMRTIFNERFTRSAEPRRAMPTPMTLAGQGGERHWPQQTDVELPIERAS